MKICFKEQWQTATAYQREWQRQRNIIIVLFNRYRELFY